MIIKIRIVVKLMKFIVDIEDNFIYCVVFIIDLRNIVFVFFVGLFLWGV